MKVSILAKTRVESSVRRNSRVCFLLFSFPQFARRKKRGKVFRQTNFGAEPNKEENIVDKQQSVLHFREKDSSSTKIKIIQKWSLTPR